MGIDLNNCPPHLADAIRKAEAQQAPAKPVTTIVVPKKQAVAASVARAFYCDPPTVTHHSKVIKGRRLVDSPELKAAVEMLMTACPHNRNDFCVAGPLWCWVQFLFRGPMMHSAFGGTSYGHKEHGTWHVSRPDCDNLAKTLIDVLVAREWILDDCKICHLEIIKSYGPQPGIAFKIASILPQHAPHQLLVGPMTGYARREDWGFQPTPIEAGVPLTTDQQIEFARTLPEKRAEYLERVKAARAAKGGA